MWLAQKTELVQAMAKLRVGLTGLRPFGSNQAMSKRKSKSQGMRIAGGTRGSSKKVPLQHIYTKVEQWIQANFSARVEVRTSHILTRFELLLAQECARQQVFQQQGKPESQERVL